ncbi:MAG: hypothetical protein ABSE49_26830, partial [Polyangiaceae bacterium]
MRRATCVLLLLGLAAMAAAAACGSPNSSGVAGPLADAGGLGADAKGGLDATGAGDAKGGTDATGGDEATGSDAGASSDATSPEGASTAESGAPPPPFDAGGGFCPGGRDVFHIAGPSGGMLGGRTAITLTSLGAGFSATTDNFLLSSSDVEDSLGLDFNTVHVPPPGTYAQGTARPDGGLQLNDFYVGSQDCEPTSGTVTVLEGAEDDAGSVLSTEITFDLTENCVGPTEELTGCVHFVRDDYSASTPPPAPDPSYDAGIVAPADAGAALA